MGDWYEDPSAPSGWRYDPAAPSPGRNPAVTMLFNAVPRVDPDRMPPETGQHAHGAEESGGPV